jgi:hypothetical protein
MQRRAFLEWSAAVASAWRRCQRRRAGHDGLMHRSFSNIPATGTRMTVPLRVAGKLEPSLSDRQQRAALLS